jgi:hypothetical protein
MGIRSLVLICAVALTSAMHLAAETSDCGNPALIVSDGRITESTFIQNTTNWYGIYTQSGHSYSVEFVPSADNFANTPKVQFTALGVFGPSDNVQGCHGTSTVLVTQNSGYSPAILKNGNGAGRRISFTAVTAGLYLIYATNGSGAGSYTFRAADTTLFNPRWTTWAGRDDQWGFFNMSDMPVTGILSIYDANSQQLTSVRFTVPAGGELVKSSYATDLNLPRNNNGYAIFSHNGPPGAIIADAYIVAPTFTVYTKFEGIAMR